MQGRRTQKELVAKVSMLLENPGFLPAGVTRLYIHSLNQTFVLIFQESNKILKFGANSMFQMLTFAAPSQSVAPEVEVPEYPRPVTIAAP